MLGRGAVVVVGMGWGRGLGMERVRVRWLSCMGLRWGGVGMSWRDRGRRGGGSSREGWWVVGGLFCVVRMEGWD